MDIAILYNSYKIYKIIKRQLEKKKEQEEPAQSSQSPYSFEHLFQFGSIETAEAETVEGTQGKYQAELCGLMSMYQAYHTLLWIKQEENYALRGSVIKCSYGTKHARLDCLRDHGVIMGNLPVMTCTDCRSTNIHNFGSCMCPESRYRGRLPMTASEHPNGQPAKKLPANEFAHICVPMIKGHWLQTEGNIEIVDKKEVAHALVKEASLTCQYGGIIRIIQTPKKDKHEKKEEIMISPWLKAYKGEPAGANGTIVTYSFEDRSKLKQIRSDIDWYSFEKQEGKNEFAEPYLVDQPFNPTEDGVLIDQNERYWITLGPKVFIPDYPDNGPCMTDEFKDYIGCRVDAVLQHMESKDEFVYIECVWSGDIKAHTFNNGIFQTGHPYPESSIAKTQPYDEDYVDGSIVEFTGKQPGDTDDERKISNGEMSKYILYYLVIYPKGYID